MSPSRPEIYNKPESKFGQWVMNILWVMYPPGSPVARIVLTSVFISMLALCVSILLLAFLFKVLERDDPVQSSYVSRLAQRRQERERLVRDSSSSPAASDAAAAPPASTLCAELSQLPPTPPTAVELKISREAVALIGA
jgi:hypothetical protein